MKKGSEKIIHTVCFTGHRDIPPAVAMALPGVLDEVIAELCERGAKIFRAGGAIGFDTLAALKVLDMKARYPDIRLELILPCRNQTELWDEHSVRTYRYILEHADSYRFLYEVYTDGCMHERDRQLAEGCNVCVAYCSRSRGGTAYTITRAIREGAELINLHDRVLHNTYHI